MAFVDFLVWWDFQIADTLMRALLDFWPFSLLFSVGALLRRMGLLELNDCEVIVLLRRYQVRHLL